MPLSLVLRGARVAQHTGDWAVPTPGTRQEMTAGRGADRPQEDRWVGTGSTEVPGPMETATDRPWLKGSRSGLFINRITLECSPGRAARPGAGSSPEGRYREAGLQIKEHNQGGVLGAHLGRGIPLPWAVSRKL